MPNGQGNETHSLQSLFFPEGKLRWLSWFEKRSGNFYLGPQQGAFWEVWAKWTRGLKEGGLNLLIWGKLHISQRPTILSCKMGIIMLPDPQESSRIKWDKEGKKFSPVPGMWQVLRKRLVVATFIVVFIIEMSHLSSMMQTLDQSFLTWEPAESFTECCKCQLLSA